MVVGSDGGSRGSGVVALAQPTQRYYRITVRVDGPRNAVSFVQSSLVGDFAVCQADGSCLPPQSGLRVHHPFDARNLAWMDPAAQTHQPVRRLYW